MMKFIYLSFFVLFSPYLAFSSHHGFQDEHSPLSSTKQVKFSTMGENNSVKEPGYLRDEHELIQGKTFSLWGIALFAGIDPFSQGIRLATKSDWSHVGLILCDENNDKYCFESTGALGQIVQQGMFPQVQIHRWEDVLKSYEGRIASREIIFPDDHKPNTEKMTDLVREYLGRRYENNFGDLIKSIRRNNLKENDTALFCSELTAKCMMDLNYLTTERLADNYLPKDFSSKEFLPLRNNIRFKPETIEVQGKNNCCCCCAIL